MTKVISLAIQKGGVGKTTSVAALTEIMVQRGYRVLAVDMDPQSSLSHMFGIEARKDHIGTVLDDDPEPIMDVIRKGIGNGFDMAPSSLKLAKVEMVIPSMRDSDRLLKKALKPILDVYDYIFIDSLPGSGKLMENVLAASTHVLIPLQSAVMDINGLAMFLDTIDAVKKSTNRKLVNAGVFLTMFDVQTKLHRAARDNIIAADVPFTGITIPRAIKAAESVGHEQSIATFQPSSKPAIAYRKLADYIEQLQMP